MLNGKTEYRIYADGTVLHQDDFEAKDNAQPYYDEELLKLPRTVQSSYELWRSCHCLKDLLPKPTFYRHRKILLGHGIDITLMRDDYQQIAVPDVIIFHITGELRDEYLS